MARGHRTAGKRRAAPATGDGRPGARTLGAAAAITACVIAWGYLVWAAIDFGTRARGGQSAGWAFMALAGLGAIACLFVGLMLIAQVSARARERSRSSTPGKRIAR